MVQFGNKSHLLRANQIAEITSSDFKMGVINKRPESLAYGEQSSPDASSSKRSLIKLSWASLSLAFLCCLSFLNLFHSLGLLVFFALL